MTERQAETPMSPPNGPALLSGRAYDSIAPRYDHLPVENRVLAHSARVSLSLVRQTVAHSRHVLEIGAGTGRETLEVAALGKEIAACDPSAESLEVLRGKAQRLGVGDRIRTHVVPASRIIELVEPYGEHGFDSAYASFSLSYEASLAPIPSQVRRLLKPGSPFLCTIFNRLCLSELAILAPFVVPERALRRLEGRMELPVGQDRVLLRAYTFRQVADAFSRDFTLENVWAVPSVIPPHYLHVLVDRAGSFRDSWEALDVLLNHRWPFKFLGSHTAYLFRARA